MFDEQLRAFKDRLFAPIAWLLAGHISANALSLAAFTLGLGSAVAAWRHVEGWGLVLWILNRCCDGLDGTLARLTNTQSDWGGYLDIVLDFTVYACIPIGFVLGATGADAPRLGLCALALLGSFYVNAASWMYLAAILARRSGATSTTTVAIPPGLIGGAETIVLYALFFLLPSARMILFVLMAALVAVTILQRLWWGASHLRA
jgi:phosphatidylglycerophosphate synthase